MILLFFMIVSLLVWPVDAKEDVIRWVDFDVSCEAMERAVELAAQARERGVTVSVSLEKQQTAALAEGVEELLERLKDQEGK